MEIDMMRIDTGAIGFTSGFSQEHKYSTVGEQITVEQLTELSIVMRISRHDHVYRHHVLPASTTITPLVDRYPACIYSIKLKIE